MKTESYKDVRGKQDTTARNGLKNALLYFHDKLFPSCLGKNFIRPIYGHTIFDDKVDNFERLIHECKKIGDFVTTDQLIEAILKKKPISGRFFHLSFDDGLRNVFANGKHIFRKYDLKPIIFINPDSIGLQDESAFEFTKSRLNISRPIQIMNWDDVNAAIDYGIDIGSHTMSHARLSEVAPNSAELTEEILGSKLKIEEKTGRVCEHFAWPYGRSSDITSEAVHQVKKSGYKSCFSAIRGSVRGIETNRYRIPRHQIEDYFSPSSARVFLRGNFEK